MGVIHSQPPRTYHNTRPLTTHFDNDLTAPGNDQTEPNIQYLLQRETFLSLINGGLEERDVMKLAQVCRRIYTFIKQEKVRSWFDELYNCRLLKNSDVNSQFGGTGHVMVLNENRFYTFGGMRDKVWNSHLYYFDCCENCNWTLFETTGSPPTPRLDFSMISYKNQIFIFGGGKDSKFNNDTFSLNLGTRVWTKIQPRSPTTPVPRQGHSSVLYESELLILGGWIGGYSMLNDLWAFNLDTHWWRKIEISSGPHDPPPFYANKMFVSRNSLIVFGGHNGNRHLNDLYLFDLETKKWDKIEQQGQLPSARGLYGAALFGTKLFVTCGNNSELGKFADLYSLNVDNWNWTKLRMHGAVPSPRFSPAVEVKGSHMFLFGGRNNLEYFNDLYVVPLEIQ